MKVLLINSNQFHSPWPVIPFGVCSIAAYIEDQGHKVRVLDNCFSKNPEQQIKKVIHEFIPEVIGISIRNIDSASGFNTMFFLDKIKKNTIEHVKMNFKGPIIIGGAAVGINAPEMLEYFDLQYAIKGDGEMAFEAFLKYISEKVMVPNIKGLVIRKNNKIIYNSEPWFVKDLNKLPLARPDSFIDLKSYFQCNSPLQIQTKRGCALECSYCVYNSIEGKEYRLRDPNLVASEIETLVNRTGVNHIEFVDSCFNLPLNHTKAVLRAIIKKKQKLRLHTMGLNPGAVDEELVDLLVNAGMNEIDVGIESGSDITLKELSKNFTKKDISKTACLLNKRKIPITWYLILGAPGETIETLKETFKYINEISKKWDIFCIAVGIRIYKGSPISSNLQNITNNNFFTPIAFEPIEIDLKTVKHITKMESLKRTNFYVYEDEKERLWLLKLSSPIFKKFFPLQPIWRGQILINKIKKILGLQFLERTIYSVKTRKKFLSW